jgi:hypothetical protein
MMFIYKNFTITIKFAGIYACQIAIGTQKEWARTHMKFLLARDYDIQSGWR